MLRRAAALAARGVLHPRDRALWSSSTAASAADFPGLPAGPPAGFTSELSLSAPAAPLPVYRALDDAGGVVAGGAPLSERLDEAEAVRARARARLRPHLTHTRTHTRMHTSDMHTLTHAHRFACTDAW